MARFQGWQANIDNASAIMKATLNFGIGAITSGPFVNEEALTWTGGSGGTGEFISAVDSDFIKLFRDTNDIPIVGSVISAAGSGASCTVTSVYTPALPHFAGSSPDFISAYVQRPVAVGEIVAIRSHAGVVRNVLSIDAEDRLTFETVWPGDNIRDQPAYVSQDATATYGLPQDPERNPVFSETIRQIDQILTVGSWIAMTPINAWTAGGRVPHYMIDPWGFVHFKGAVVGSSHTNVKFFVLPAGFRPDVAMRLCVFTLQTAGSNNLIGFVEISTDGSMSYLASDQSTPSIAQPDIVEISSIVPFRIA